MSHKLLGIATLLYVLVFFLHALFFATRKQKLISVIWLSLYVTLAIQMVGIILRWIESYGLGIGHAPLSNFYESLVFYSWCISFVLVVMKKRIYSYPLITMLVSLVSLAFIGYASISPSVERNIQPLIPALQSNWLHIHVVTCFIAYASFAVSFIASLLYFVEWKGMLPPKETMEEINYRSIIVGFLMLSAGILTGAVWAHYAWGTYWSWDPKETWSLITWIVYAVFLHARLVKGWKGKKLALLSVTGFVCVIFTYFGVNFLLSGLHSYGTK
jgi:ABC-type transport system involved in cytochrome c biogenesis permease subunit